ncbi:MAG: hypothetical protein WA051_02310 [Minisyncoccia bacterium]
MTGITEKTLKAIETARTKSEAARHTIALLIAGAFTFIVFLIWIFVLLPFRLDSNAQVADTTSNSPFSALMAQVNGAYGDLVENINGQLKKINSSDTPSLQDSYNRIKSNVQEDTQNPN